MSTGQSSPHTTGLGVGAVLAGRYRVLSSEGTVAEAVDLKLGRRVSIKAVLNQSAEDRARLRREALVMGALASPHIVAILGYVDEGEGPAFLIRESASGKTVDVVLAEEGVFTIARASHIVRQVLLALAAAHKAEVVHRGLCSGNVLITQSGPLGEVARVVDFGLAHVKAEAGVLTRTGIALGPLGYMAPEQAAGVPPTPETDIFGVGMLLYEMVVGVGRARSGFIRPIDQVAPHLPSAFCALVSRALDAVPARRFSSAEQMFDALAPFAASATGSVAERASDTVVDRRRPMTRSRPRLWWLAAFVALVGGGLGLGAVLWRGGPRSAHVAPLATSASEPDRTTPASVPTALPTSLPSAATSPRQSPSKPPSATRPAVTALAKTKLEPTGGMPRIACTSEGQGVCPDDARCAGFGPATEGICKCNEHLDLYCDNRCVKRRPEHCESCAPCDPGKVCVTASGGLVHANSPSGVAHCAPCRELNLATCPNVRQCVDLSRSQAHCGSCGHACSLDQACVSGACYRTRQFGESCTDRDVCPMDKDARCVDGVCACPLGTKICAGSCNKLCR